MIGDWGCGATAATREGRRAEGLRAGPPVGQGRVRESEPRKEGNGDWRKLAKPLHI
jgi:hypothetical protein